MNMAKKILALDMGGTSVKAAVFDWSGQEMMKVRWEHAYKESSLEDAKGDLLARINQFCDKDIDALGLSVAGLVATDKSLYKSTVLTSFTGFNISEFLKEELGVKHATIDNDADCGALAEYSGSKFLFVIVGSGVGSAYIDKDGNLPYLKRFKVGTHFHESDNPIINDIGLRITIPYESVIERFGRLNIGEKWVSKYLDNKEIKMGELGSALGMKRIIEIVMPKYASYYMKRGFQDINQDSRVANVLAKNAVFGDPFALYAFRIFASFLGYGIRKAARVLEQEQGINLIEECLEIKLGGAIMDSYMLFNGYLREELSKEKMNYKLTQAEKSNLYGAYMRARCQL
jgi:hypothetical protein